jgi:signal peptidase I
VSAGNSNKNFSSTIELETNIYDLDMVAEDTKVSPESCDVYVVVGGSMKNSNIDDGDFVFVNKLYEDEKYNVKKDNILLIGIDRSRDLEPKSDNVEYKLRKHISYINSNNDFDAWINSLSANDNAIFANKEHIRTKYKECVKKHRANNSDEKFVFTFSSTRDEGTNEVKYSFHPVKFLNGIVHYVLKNKEIPE